MRLRSFEKKCNNAAMGAAVLDQFVEEKMRYFLMASVIFRAYLKGERAAYDDLKVQAEQKRFADHLNDLFDLVAKRRKTELAESWECILGYERSCREYELIINLLCDEIRWNRPMMTEEMIGLVREEVDAMMPILQ